MAHLKTKFTINNLTEREKWKWILVKSLYEKGYQKKRIYKLFKFIDLMMTLPPILQTNLKQKIVTYEEEKKMPLISPLEQMAKEEGLTEGLEQGFQQRIDQEKELIIRLLNRKLGSINDQSKVLVKALTVDKLEQLAEDLLDFNTVDDLQKWFSNV